MIGNGIRVREGVSILKLVCYCYIRVRYDFIYLSHEADTLSAITQTQFAEFIHRNLLDVSTRRLVAIWIHANVPSDAADVAAGVTAAALAERWLSAARTTAGLDGIVLATDADLAAYHDSTPKYDQGSRALAGSLAWA